MSNACTWSIEDGVGIITIDSPPVNALSARVRQGLHEGFRALAADDAVGAVVLICAGRTFCAGADISELGKPMDGTGLLEVFDIIETGSKPVIAAIHGTALGGGYEFALICHYRIAVPSAKVGLPEVNLGLLPGGGGTQRLPRLVGIETALELLTSGEQVPAPRALELGMIDALAQEGRLREDAIAFASSWSPSSGRSSACATNKTRYEAARGHPEIFASFLSRHAQAFRGLKAPINIVKAVEAAAELPSFDDGIKRERELFVEMWRSSEAAARTYYFSAERETAKVPDVRRTRPHAGEGRRRGRGRLVGRRHRAELARCRPAGDELRCGRADAVLDAEALSRTDLLIEASELPPAERRELIGRLDRICRPETLIALERRFPSPSTSWPRATSRPARILGMHFFIAPQNSRLIEVVRGGKTSNETIATAMKFAKSMGKVAVLSRASEDLIADRVMGAMRAPAEALLIEGVRQGEIDRAIYDFGFPTGPFQMANSAGRRLLASDEPPRTLAGELQHQCRPAGRRHRGARCYIRQ